MGSSTACPSIATIKSPVLSPARAAGLCGVTLATSAPAGRLSPRLSAISGVTACSRAPSQGRFTALPPPCAEATTTLHHVGRDGEADALRAAGAREDRGVDADQPAAKIDQRAAGIAGIDGGIGLDEELIVGDADLGARQRRDDAVGHGLPDAERIADREHHVADLQRVGIGEFERGKALAAASLMRSTARSERESLSTISASNSRLSASETLTWSAPSMTWLLVTTRPEASTITPEPSERCTCSPGPPGIRHAEEAAEDRIVEQRVAVRDGLGGVDVDHRGRRALDHRRVGQPQLVRARWARGAPARMRRARRTASRRAAAAKQRARSHGVQRHGKSRFGAAQI